MKHLRVGRFGIVVGAVVVAVLAFSVPTAGAAEHRFSFTTPGGSTYSFTLPDFADGEMGGLLSTLLSDDTDFESGAPEWSATESSKRISLTSKELVELNFFRTPNSRQQQVQRAVGDLNKMIYQYNGRKADLTVRSALTDSARGRAIADLNNAERHAQQEIENVRSQEKVLIALSQSTKTNQERTDQAVNQFVGYAMNARGAVGTATNRIAAVRNS